MEYYISIIFWFSLFITTLIIEGTTSQLVSIWFSLGSIFAVLLALCHVNIGFQIGAFVLVSVLSLVLFRKICIGHLKSNQKFSESLVGHKAKIVLLSENASYGQINLKGVIWDYMPENINEVFEVGQVVEVTKQDGNLLYVSSINGKE